MELYSKVDGSGGGSAVVHDPLDVFLGVACHFLMIAGNSVHAELLACKREVQLVLEVGVMDNQGVAQSLAQQEIDRSRFAPSLKRLESY